MNRPAMSAVPVGDHKVADPSLADWGRREIRIAETEMPALMKIREITVAPSRWPVRESAAAST